MSTKKKPRAGKRKSKKSSRRPWGKSPKKGLVDAQAMERKHPKTFEAPSKDELDAVTQGDYVKAAVKIGGKGNPNAERMWFQVLETKGKTFRTQLHSIPGWVDVHGLSYGDKVEIPRKSVYEVLPSTEANPAKPPRLMPGQLVRYTADFLRSTGQYTPPINGMVVGSVGDYVLVVWSDDDRRAVRVLPLNLEIDRRAMAQASDAHLQSVLKELQRATGVGSERASNAQRLKRQLLR